MINIVRNLGGSIGVASVQTSLQQRQQFRQSRLVEHTLPSDIHLQEFIQRATEYFQSSGSSAVDAARKAYALFKQATLLSYIDTFCILAVLCFLALPLAFVLRPIPLGKAGAPH